LRYDFEAGLGFFVDPDYHSVQPRVGFAYSPDSKTVIRAGYGIFYDKYTLTFFFVSGPQRPLNYPGLPFSNNMNTGTWLINSMFLAPVPCGGSNCPAGTVPLSTIQQAFENLITAGSFPVNFSNFQGGSVVDRKQRHPYSEQFSLEIDREIGKGLSVSAGYLFVAGHKLVRPANLNIAPHIGTLPNGKFLYNFALPVQFPGSDPNLSKGSGGIFYFTDSSGNSVYHGLTFQATEKAGKYFRLNANYTFSKTLDDGTFLVFVWSAPYRTRMSATGLWPTSWPMGRRIHSCDTSNSAVSSPCSRRGRSQSSSDSTPITMATR